MTLLIDGTVKISLIIAAALAVSAMLRGRSAALRHWVLAMAVLGAAASPLVSAVAPSWSLGFGIAPAASPDTSTPVAPPRAASSPVVVSPGAQATPAIDPAAAVAAILTLWIAGVLVAGGILTAGFVRLACLARAATPVNAERWNVAAADIARRLGLRRPVGILRSDHPAMLVTWGLTKPRVLLPAGSGDWPDDRIRAVLAHELAHVGRADWMVQMVAEVLRSACWFNPLVWLACRRLRQESEHACDDAVLRLGIQGTDYASQLLSLARSVRAHRRPWLPAPAMGHTSSLERRITAMLNTRVNRTPLTRPARVATTAALAALTVAISGLAIGAQTFASFSGSVFDPTNRIVPNVTMVLINAQSGAKYEIKSDSTGRFEFVGLPPGDYELEARLPGFKTLTGAVRLAGKNASEDVTLEVGTLQESITVSDAGSSGSPASSTSGPRPKRGIGDCRALPAVGGNIRAPWKVRDVRPIYPAHLRGTGTETTVRLEGRIDTEGYIRDLQLVGTADPAFVQSAMDAVRQWEFDQTLLNCTPTDVIINVTINFKP